jgi:hypothetical protein
VGARSRPQSSSLCSRLSADNVKQAGRHLGKLCHGYAPAVFAVALEQLQAYANLVAPVVAAFKYLTPLGVDVLMCTSALGSGHAVSRRARLARIDVGAGAGGAVSLLEALANPDKERLKEDGTSVAAWLTGPPGSSPVVHAPTHSPAPRYCSVCACILLCSLSLSLRPYHVCGRAVPAVRHGGAGAAARVHGAAAET